MTRPNPYRSRHACAVLLVILFAACGGGGGGSAPSEWSFADFQSPQAFVAHPYVQRLLDVGDMSVHLGTDPPQMEGSYSAVEHVLLNEFDPSEEGTTGPFSLRLMNQLGDHIDLDPGGDFGIQETRSFITGDGDSFTIWRVTTLDLILVDCQLLIVEVLTGHRHSNGDLNGLLGGTVIRVSGGECYLIGTPAPPGSCSVGTFEAFYAGLP